MSTTLGVHVSWTGKPGDAYVQWSDISGDVVSVDTQRGRSTELDAVQTGTASIGIDNWDGSYTPGRPYGPELLPPHAAQTDSASWWTAGPHSAISVQSGTLTPPAAYLGSSTYLEIDSTNAVAQEDIAYSTSVPVTPGKSYRGSSLMLTGDGSSRNVSSRIAFYNAAGAEITAGLNYDFAYNQYPDVIRMSLPATYHRMGAGETLTTSSAAVVGPDPMVCYNVTTSPTSWDKNGTGTSASFNGTSSVAEPCGLNLAVQAPGAGSVEFWFRTGASGPILADYRVGGPVWYNAISATGAPDLSSSRLWPALYVGTDGFLYCQASSLATVQVKSPYVVNDSWWHHYAVTDRGGYVSYYLDGVLIGFDPQAIGPSRPIIGCADFTNNPTLQNNAFTPMAAKPATNWFNGQVTDFAQYRHGLGAADVADHYRHGSTGTRKLPVNTGANAGKWFPVQACGTAPAGAVKASLVVRTEAALTTSALFLYSPSLKQIAPNYGKIRPRRKIRVFSTTGQNLMPPGMNLGYQTFSGIPAGVDANETGAWVLAGGTNIGFTNGVTTYSANSSAVASLPLYGPSGNGLAVPWMLIPGNSYTFTAQVAAWQFGANSTGVTIGINTTVNSAPGSSTLFNGSVTPQVISKGDTSWKTVSWSFTIPTTYQQPEFLFTVNTTETVSSGAYGWNTAIRNLQLVDVTNGQTVPGYTAGDGTMPVFQGFVDKWESLTDYDDTAMVVASCSDAMRIMGDTQLPYAPVATGFQPDWKVLGAYDQTGKVGFTFLDPNGQAIGAYMSSTNVLYNNMVYSPDISGAALPGTFLGGGGNPGASWQVSPAIYLMSFGKLPAAMSVEFWYIPRSSTSDPNPGVYPTGDQYYSAYGPVLSMYSNGTANYFSCGWTDRNANTASTPIGAATDMLKGGHAALEMTTSGGSAPTVQTKCYYNGTLLMTTANQSLVVPPSAPQFRLSGPSATLNIAGVNITAATFELYAPATYGAVGLNWAQRLSVFKSGRLSGTWDNAHVIDGPAAQTVLPWLMGACGLARPSSQLVTGSPSTSTASLVDPPSFTSGSGLDALNVVAAQIGGLVCMSRYSAVMVQDSAYRTDAITPFVFSALGSTAPDGSLLFLSDIDRTWTSVDGTAAGQSNTESNYPAFLTYGSHMQSMNIRRSDLNHSARMSNFLSTYMIPNTRCDAASFTVVNQDLAASVMRVDVGSRVAFTDLPANCPTDSYFAWVESVSVSGKADGGTIVPTVTLSLSPDLTRLPIQ